MNVRSIIYSLRNILSIFFWNIGFHKIEKRMEREYYSKSTLPPKPRKRQVVFMVDGRQKHGGLADRFRSICTIYQWCVVHNLDFKLYYASPFKLEDYIEPNNYDWICNDALDYNSTSSKPVILFDYMFPVKYHEMYLNLLRIFSKKDLHIYTYTFFNINTYGENFRTLFKPVSKLQEQIDFHKHKIGSDYIAVVTRFQQLLGDFKEGEFKVLPENERKQLIEKCVNKVKELHREGERILCTSDSSTFLREVSKLDYVYTMPGKVVHIDYTDGANYDTFMKSFLDFYMIGGAKHVHLLQTGDMYRSGFPGAAAIAFNKPWDIIEFDDNKQNVINGSI